MGLPGQAFGGGGSPSRDCTFLSFGQFAVAMGIAERARKALEDEPLTVAGARGGMILNPNLRAWRDAVMVLVRIGAEFGATPSSLTGMGLAQLKGKTLQQELADRYRKAT